MRGHFHRLLEASEPLRRGRNAAYKFFLRCATSVDFRRWGAKWAGGATCDTFRFSFSLSLPFILCEMKFSNSWSLGFTLAAVAQGAVIHSRAADGPSVQIANGTVKGLSIPSFNQEGQPSASPTRSSCPAPR